MSVFAVGIELANVAAVQSSHDADPGEHRRAVLLHHQHERFDRGLPFRLRGFFFGNAVMKVAASRSVTNVRPSGRESVRRNGAASRIRISLTQPA
jgi:hypothetical protein